MSLAAPKVVKTIISSAKIYPNDSSVSACFRFKLLWRHYGRDGVSNHQPHECLLNRLFRLRSKKTTKLRVTGLCVGNSPVTGEFPAQMASNADNAFIWWCHHEVWSPVWTYQSFTWTRGTYGTDLRTVISYFSDWCRKLHSSECNINFMRFVWIKVFAKSGPKARNWLFIQSLKRKCIGNLNRTEMNWS